MDADLGWQFSAGRQGRHGLFGEGQARVQIGHRTLHVCRREIEERWRVGQWHHPRVYASTIAYDAGVAPIDVEQSLENLKLERDAIVLYDALSQIEKDQRRADAFRRIASNERRHADIWASKLRDLGATVPDGRGPRPRVRIIILIARVFGTASVAELVKALEGDEEELYEGQGVSPEVAAIAADEREHAEIWDRLKVEGGSSDPDEAGRDGVAIARRAGSAAEVGQRERWHRTGRSGTLRAIIFGVSDGLVSNLSLVMGVTGAAAGNPSFILLAGVAGLLAGAFSMAAGEYISMQSQRELFEHQIALEEAMPEEEEAELAAAYRAKGFTADEAARIAARIFKDPATALDMLVREELGLDPDELGSAWGAAGGSFVAFSIGAVVPVIPYLIGDGTGALAASLGLSLAALFAVGASVSLLTGRGALFSGARQLGIGVAASLVTYAIGSLIGVSIAG
jgi:VIT1/CCC1 family predicted Fe2+/Mn2+ transporter/rubrerythrin